MVFEGEEEAACCRAESVVRGDIGILPGKGGDILQNWIALLTRRDEDGGDGLA